MAPVEARIFKSSEHQPEIVTIPEGHDRILNLADTEVCVNWNKDNSGTSLTIKDPESVRVIQQTTLGGHSAEVAVPSDQEIPCGQSPYRTTIIVDPNSGEALLLQHKDSRVIGTFQRHRKD